MHSFNFHTETQRQRRRKKRSVGSTVGVLIVGGFFCILAIWAIGKYCKDCSPENQQGEDIENGRRVAAREIQPESPEGRMPPRRDRSRERKGKARQGRHRSRSNSQTRLSKPNLAGSPGPFNQMGWANLEIFFVPPIFCLQYDLQKLCVGGGGGICLFR